MEKKLETLNEFVQIYEEMDKATNTGGGGASQQDAQYHSDLYNSLLHIKEDFHCKDRHWRAIVISNAE